MCIRDSLPGVGEVELGDVDPVLLRQLDEDPDRGGGEDPEPVSYTHLRAHETVLDLVCRLLLEKKKHR